MPRAECEGCGLVREIEGDPAGWECERCKTTSPKASAEVSEDSPRPQESVGVGYDPAVIQAAANALYRVSGLLALLAALACALAAGVVGNGLAGPAAGISLAGIGFVAGGVVGWSGTLVLRLLGQLGLCLREVERNTRGSGARPHSLVS